MRLDHDLVRRLLLLTEERTDGIRMLSDADFYRWLPGEDEAKVSYHLKYLADAGLVEYEPYHYNDITPKGRDYLDSIRDDTVWGKAKGKVSRYGHVSFGVLADIAKEILLSSLLK